MTDKDLEARAAKTLVRWVDERYREALAAADAMVDAYADVEVATAESDRVMLPAIDAYRKARDLEARTRVTEQGARPVYQRDGELLCTGCHMPLTTKGGHDDGWPCLCREAMERAQARVTELEGQVGELREALERIKDSRSNYPRELREMAAEALAPNPDTLP